MPTNEGDFVLPTVTQLADNQALPAELFTHRSCAPEHAGIVQQMCLVDRRVLPRWHQFDRGIRDAHRGLHVSAPVGAYQGIPAWHGRAHWLAVVVPVAIAVHRQVLKDEELSPDTFRAWAKVESGYVQDQRTGRRCVVRPSTVASVLQISVDRVRVCRRVARKIGLQVVVMMGRMLSLEESTKCRRAGSPQRGLSTETALTLPARLYRARRCVDSAIPTRGRSSPSKTHLPHLSLQGLAAQKKEAAPPPLRARGPASGFGARQVAGDVIRLVPWLRGESPRRLAPSLHRFLTCDRPWTAVDLALALQDTTLRTGRGVITADRIRTRPAALAAYLLRSVDEVIDNPQLAVFESTTTSCDREDCDHGWVTVSGGVAKCPDCSPSARANRTESDEEPEF